MGKQTGENIVAACQKCNGAKGDKTHGWKPLYKPYKPGYWELVRKRKQMDYTIKHPSWETFI